MYNIVKLRERCGDPSQTLELGKAAEHIACADIILEGHRCYPSDQGLPYDLVLDSGGRMLRVQVKAACFTKNINAQGRNERIAYSFSARRRGRFGSQRLTESDCDLMAFVALDIRRVAYLALRDVGQTVQLLPPDGEFQTRLSRRLCMQIDKLPLSAALARLDGTEYEAQGGIEYKGERKSIREWARQFGTNETLISSRLARGWPAELALTAPPDQGWPTGVNGQRLVF